MADTNGKDWRNTRTRRPSAYGSQRSDPDPLEPPTMSRSRVQIAGSLYRPSIVCERTAWKNAVDSRAASSVILA